MSPCSCSTQAGQKRSSHIAISQFSADSDVTTASEKFQTALASGNVTAICEEHIEQAKTEEEKADWRVMESLIAENTREKIVEYLGLKEEAVTNGEAAEAAEQEAPAKAEEESAEKEKEKGVSDFFGGGDGDGEGEDFLSNLAATKGAKTDNPFQIFSDSDTSVEKNVTKALLLGNFAKATDICLKEGRIADAFLIANCGGQELVDKVQSAYIAQKSGMPSYMRLLGSVIAKNLWDVVYNADLANWKESMAVLCTFSDPVEFPDLCEALGDRIIEQGSRKDASFCYLVGSKLEKVVTIWAAELKEAEQAGINQSSDDSTFSVHARSLQDFIEKVTIFRHVTKFQDTEKGLDSGWKLAALYDKYTEYADILAGQGQLTVAQQYLDLLPATYPAAELARNRVKLATQKAAPKTVAARQTAATTRVPSRAQPTQPLTGYQPPQPAPIVPTPGPYAGFGQTPNPVPQQQPYAPPSTNPYQPSQGFQPTHGYQPAAAQPSYQGAVAPPPMAGPPMAGPPRSGTPSSMTPAARVKNMENWNDVPLVSKAPPRKSTPSVAPITSPFPGQQQGLGAPPPPNAYGAGAGPTPPPPPKSTGPPRMQSPLTTPSQGPPQGPPQSFGGPPRPSSTAANQYAPPPPQPGATPSYPGVMPRTASPYNAPPAGGPPSNRYTPVATPQPQAQPPVSSMPPPPGSRPPPPSMYGAPPQQSTPHQYAPSPYAPQAQASAQAPPQGPPQGPPSGPPPMGRVGPPPSAPPQATPPPPAAAAAAPPRAKHPPGDRSHIPANAQGLVALLDQDMQRVASKAPATFAPQVKDTQKRLGLLFDHLNNEELIQPATIEQLSQLASAIEAKDYATAQRLQLDIQRDKTEECGNWMVGVKRLISMSKATP
jgi:protein transport protein SEC31